MNPDILYALPSPVYWVMVVLWGLALGSFTTCVMYRVPRGISLWRQQDGSYRSFCPSCRHELQWMDLIPIVSWVIQKGRCRYCQAKIGAYYPMVELLVVFCVILVGYACNGGLHFFIMSFLVPFFAGLGAWAKERLKEHSGR